MEAQKEGDKKTVKTPTQQTEHLSEIETLLDAVSTYEPLVTLNKTQKTMPVMTDHA